MLLFEKDISGFLEEEVIDVLCNLGSKINDNYIYEIASDKENQIVFYSIDNMIDIYNCPSGIIYKIEKTISKKDAFEKIEINVYILFIATAYRFRKVGYATLFIKEFIEFIKKKYNNPRYSSVKIILDSIIDAVTFYEYIGFKWITTNEYNKQFKIEEDSNVEHFIMIYEL